MFVCYICDEVLFSRLDFVQHLRLRHEVSGNCLCRPCDVRYSTMNSYRNHLRMRHPQGNVFGPYLPPDWEVIETPAAEELRVAAEEIPGPAAEELLEPAAFQQPDVENDLDLMDPFEEEILDEVQAVEPDEVFDAVVEPFIESCFNNWLEFHHHPDSTIKSADLVCNMLMENARNSILLCQPYLPPEVSYRIASMIKYKLLPFSTEYRRRRYLESRGLYAKPEEYLTSITQDVVGTPAGNVLRNRRNVVAVVPLEKTITSVLSIESVANAMVMPSQFANSPTLNHAFAGRRAQKLFNAIGEDYIMIELYMDEFTTTCPIGNSSVVYKMAAWYFRILNLPLDILSQLDHILLACMAHAVDVMEDLQEIIRIVLLPQLKKLERDGVTFVYNGTEKTFKVILLRLSADNLGFHQLVGLTKCFSGNNPCWMCTETAETLRHVWTLDLQKLRTREKYDRLIARGTYQQRLEYGITAPCVFNELQYFHCMEDFSVDYMHDLHEGHFLRFLPRIFRDAVAAGYSLETINNAIAALGPVGDDGRNPLRPIYLPNEAPPNGDTLGGYTAKNAGVLVKLLPLMFKCARIRLQTRSWQVFMKLQRILDILYAPEINQATIDMFDALVKAYLRDYIAVGGKMTVKPHKLLHYKPVMEEMGPLRHLATFRMEANHHPFKQYAHVNRCFKNLQTTLADKNELMFAYTLQQMKAPDYLDSRRKNRSLAKFKKYLGVVYGQDPVTKEPKFGEICNYDVNTDRLTLKILVLEEFDESSYCYVAARTENVIEVLVPSLLCPEPVAIYRKSKNYIRMPYMLMP